MVLSAEAHGCDATKDELHPSNYWHRLADNAMRRDDNAPDLAVDSFLEVELQVDAHGNLRDQHEHDEGHELSVDVLGELSALVLMSEEVSDDCEE